MRPVGVARSRVGLNTTVMADEARTGRCLCGAVRYRVSGPVRDRCFCHCESCRRATSAPFVAWGTVDRDRFELTRGELSIIASSERVERGFCAACGASLTYANALRAGEVDFTLVSLDEPARVAPEAHIWVRDKLPWVSISDGLLRYSTVVSAAPIP